MMRVSGTTLARNPVDANLAVRCRLYRSSALMEIALALVFGTALGAAVAWAIGRARAATLTTALEYERSSAAEKVALLDGARAQLETTLKAVASDALQASNASF